MVQALLSISNFKSIFRASLCLIGVLVITSTGWAQESTNAPANEAGEKKAVTETNLPAADAQAPPAESASLPESGSTPATKDENRNKPDKQQEATATADHSSGQSITSPTAASASANTSTERANLPSSNTKPPLRTGPGASAFVGAVSGVGLGYRQHFGRVGFQIGGLPAFGSEAGFVTAGSQVMLTFFRKNQARIYALAGMGVFYGYEELEGPDERNLTLAPGAGVGVALNAKSGFFVAFDLPIAVYLDFERGEFKNDNIRIFPTPSAAIGYYF